MNGPGPYDAAHKRDGRCDTRAGLSPLCPHMRTLLHGSRLARTCLALAVISHGGLAFAGCAPAPQRAPESPGPTSATPTSPSAAPDYAAVLESADRDAADKALDAGRHPHELLEFAGVRPGMRVAELGAGTGYTAELLARVVGPERHVFGHNSEFILNRYARAPWGARLKKPVMSNVTRFDGEFDAPLPPDAKNLDAVLLVLFYHDTVWMETDRPRMNKAIFDALKPGGVFVVVDHSAKSGDGLANVKSLHRIEEGLVLQELESAGFELEESADFLRNPQDTRDWSASPSTAGERRGTSDRFVLRFRKPTD